jgi:tRNA dimethylallyltransferase
MVNSESLSAQQQPLRIIVVTGPTATGKTALGVKLARELGGEVISADSRQVYRGMDIGTGKDLQLYQDPALGKPVEYHLIDVADPNETYNLHRYVNDLQKVLSGVRQREKVPVIVGGTPLYIKAVLEEYDLEGGPPDPALRRQLENETVAKLTEKLYNYDPELCQRTDLTQKIRIIRGIEIALSRAKKQTTDKQNTRKEFLIMGVYYHRKEVHARIEKRLHERIQEGMIEEVERLHSQGVSWEQLDFLGLEYRWTAKYLLGELSYDEFVDKLFTMIRRFCKSQDIWFRKFERDGWPIHWIQQGQSRKALELAETFLAGEKLPDPEFQLNDVVYGPRQP